jgi:hypothetical protein
VTTEGVGVTTTAFSHALNPSAAISAAKSIEYLMVVPLILLTTNA